MNSSLYDTFQFYDASTDIDKGIIWDLICEISKGENVSICNLLLTHCESFINQLHGKKIKNQEMVPVKTVELHASYYRCPDELIVLLFDHSKIAKYVNIYKDEFIIETEEQFQKYQLWFPKVKFTVNITTNVVTNDKNDTLEYQKKHIQKDKEKKKNHGNNKNHAKMSSIDQTRSNQRYNDVKNQISQLKRESSDFFSKCVEIILTYYFMRCEYFIQRCSKNSNAVDLNDLENYVNNVLSFRDALDFFSIHVQDIQDIQNVKQLHKNNFNNKNNSNHKNMKKTDVIQKNVPQDISLHFFEQLFHSVCKFVQHEYFLLHGTKFLLMNHFKSNHQSSTKAFKEQLDFIQALVSNPYGLYVLPWGVGVGKTALLPVISSFFTKDVKKKMFYCVFAGPVRDQNAAYLYRCGIPFALIVKGKKYKELKEKETQLRNQNKQYNQNQSQTNDENYLNSDFIYPAIIDSSNDGVTDEYSQELMWELQPSFHCNSSDKKYPQVYIVEPEFMEYFILYKKKVEKLLAFDVAKRDIPSMSIFVPNKKHRYRHLRKEHLWPKSNEYGIIIDEPDRNNVHLNFILHHLPESSFLMSATDSDVLTMEMKISYQIRNDEQTRFYEEDEETANYLIHHLPHETIYIPGKTIGVSTSLRAGFLPNCPVISPFHGVRNYQQFITRLEHVKNNPSLSRFLSPEVFYNLFNQIISQLPADHRLLFTEIMDLNLRTISFTDIANKIIEMMELLSETKRNDSFYEEHFAFSKEIYEKYSGLTDQQYDQLLYNMMHELMVSQSSHFLKGCLIATHSIHDFYKMFHSLYKTKISDNNYSLQQFENLIQENVTECKSAMIEQQKHRMKTEEDENNAQELCEEIYKKIMKRIPIPQAEIFNTKRYIERYSLNQSRNSTHCTFSDVLPLIEEDDLMVNPISWNLKLPISQNIPEYVNLWKCFGLGSLDYSRENYLRNIFDSDNNKTAFLLSDKNTAYGLNIKIAHAILCDLNPKTFLNKNAYLQMSGRVGRSNQSEIGDVWILSPFLFDHLVLN